MKTQREWNDEPDLWAAICQALKDSGLDVWGSDEEGPHGERGQITIDTEDGRSFSLQLWETKRW